MDLVSIDLVEDLQETHEEVDDVQVDRNAGEDIVLGAEVVHDHVDVKDEEHTEHARRRHVHEEREGRGHEEDLQTSSLNVAPTWRMEAMRRMLESEKTVA